jgi:hypothetical protein
VSGDPEGDRPPVATPGPLSFTAMLRAAWRLYRLRPQVVIPVFAAFYLALALLALVAVNADDLSRAPQLAVGIVFQFGVPVVGSVLTALAIIVMHDASVGAPSGFGTAVRALRPMSKEVLASALLAAVLALVLYIPPLSLIAVYIGTSGLSAILFGPPLVIHVLTLERKSLAGSWPRTRALLSGSWARILLYWLTGALAITVLGGLVTVPAATAGRTALLVVNGVVLGVLVPYLVALVYASYLDLRSLTAGESPG